MSFMPGHIEFMRQKGLLKTNHTPDPGAVYVDIRIDLSDNEVKHDELMKYVSENIRKMLR